MMLTNKPKIVSAFLLIFFSVSSHAQSLSLDDFVRSILKHNPGVQEILAEEAIAAARLRSSYGVDDTTLGGSLGLLHGEPDPILGNEPNTIDTQKYGITLERILSRSGTRLSLAYGNSVNERDPDPASSSIVGQYSQPSVTLQITQPLLKNFGGVQDRLAINQERLGLELTRLSVREELESYISRLSALYLDWYLSGREVEILQHVYEQVIEQERIVRLKVRRQVSESHELLRIQETRQDYYSRWQISIGKYKGLSRQIVNQMAGANTVSESLEPVDPLASGLISGIKFNSDSATYLTEQSRLRKILDIISKQRSVLLKARKDAESADLSLALGYTLHGVENDALAPSASGINRDDYSVSLQYRYPLGNRQASGKYQEELASRRKSDAAMQKRLIDARSGFDNYIAQIDALELAITSSNKKLALAAEKIKQETRLYKIGRLDLFQLIQDQKSFLESQISNIQSEVQLLKLKISVGELLDSNLAAYSAE